LHERISGIVITSLNPSQYSFSSGFDPQIIFLPSHKILKNYFGTFLFVLIRLLLLEIPKVLCLKEGNVDLIALILSKCCDYTLIPDFSKDSGINFSLHNGQQVLLEQDFFRDLFGLSTINLMYNSKKGSNCSFDIYQAKRSSLIDEIIKKDGTTLDLKESTPKGAEFDPLTQIGISRCISLIEKQNSLGEKSTNFVRSVNPSIIPWDLKTFLDLKDEPNIIPPRNHSLLRFPKQFLEVTEDISRGFNTPDCQKLWEASCELFEKKNY